MIRTRRWSAFGGRSPGALILTLTLALAAAPGCVSDGERPGASTSTLGTDLLRAPRGSTVPPPSIGIDLVDFRAPVGARLAAKSF